MPYVRLVHEQHRRKTYETAQLEGYINFQDTVGWLVMTNQLNYQPNYTY